MTAPQAGRCRFHAMLPVDPDEQVGSVPPGGDPADAVVTDMRFRHVYGTMLLHREHDLYIADPDYGRHLQNLIRDRLLAERFSLDDADEWAFRNWRKWLLPPTELYNERQDPWLCDQVTQAAVAYRATGIPVDEAFGWTIRSLNATYAVHIRNHGWNPTTYSALVVLCTQHAEAEGMNWVDDTDKWIDAPIVSWRALRYLQAGLTLDEALEQEALRLGGEDVDAAIDTLIGLKCPEHP